MDKEIQLRRLSLIKYLFNKGVEQSYLPEPINSFSILSLHDSVEMFLIMADQVTNGNSNRQKLADFWGDKGLPLEMKSEIMFLNAQRVKVKHKGDYLSQFDIESSRVHARTFLDRYTPYFFKVEFDRISLCDLIKFSETKKWLQKAEIEISAKSFKEASNSVASAFYELLGEYKRTKEVKWERFSPFSNTAQIRGIGGDRDSLQIERKIDAVITKLNNNFKRIDDALEIVLLGLDYKKYIKFKVLAPHIYKKFGGEFTYMTANESLNEIDCNFLFDFVLDSALKLQEFDYDILSLKNRVTKSQ